MLGSWLDVCQKLAWHGSQSRSANGYSGFAHWHRDSSCEREKKLGDSRSIEHTFEQAHERVNFEHVTLAGEPVSTVGQRTIERGIRHRTQFALQLTIEAYSGESIGQQSGQLLLAAWLPELLLGHMAMIDPGIYDAVYSNAAASLGRSIGRNLVTLIKGLGKRGEGCRSLKRGNRKEHATRWKDSHADIGSLQTVAWY